MDSSCVKSSDSFHTSDMNCHLTILFAQLVPESKSLRLLVCHREPKGTALELNLGEPRDRSLGTKEKFHFNPLSASFL